ncbi:MAG: Hsp33 family molecular chaperone HslO [Spirochaetes bacterium]|nr:Hsp33 family molecular chaperone HslO [Spirochaetota bacterium]
MISRPIDDIDLMALLGRVAPDGATVFTLEGDTVRGAIAGSTNMVNRMRANHCLGILETLILGQAYTAAALLSTTIKGDDRLTVRFDGDGPVHGFSVEASARGEVRGRLFNAPIPVDRPLESFDTAPWLGDGSLTVTRYMEGKSDPFSGRVAVRQRGIAGSLARYYLESEQVKTSFSLSVKFDARGRAIGAGGLYLQLLPGAPDDAADRVERLVEGLPSIGEFLAGGGSRRDFMNRAFPFFDVNVLGEKNAEFFCGCTRERLAVFISSMGADELRGLATDGPFPVEVICHNCGSAYHYGKEDIETLYEAENRRGGDHREVTR